MTTQITVRINDELVAFADTLVGQGAARSRAQVVEQALRREQRRMAAERDARIYASTQPDCDLEAFTSAATAQTWDELD